MASYHDPIDDWPAGEDELSVGQPEAEGAEYYVGGYKARKGRGKKDESSPISSFPLLTLPPLPRLDRGCHLPGRSGRKKMGKYMRRQLQKQLILEQGRRHEKENRAHHVFLPVLLRLSFRRINSTTLSR